MKKIIGLIFLFSVGFMGVYAQDDNADAKQKGAPKKGPQLSILAGGLFAADLSQIKAASNDRDYITDINAVGGGGFIGFDATYFEAAVSLEGSSSTLKYSGGYPESTGNYFQAFNLGLSLLCKYPFYFGNIALFPLLGFEYKIVLSQSLDGAQLSDSYYKDVLLCTKSDFNTLAVHFGLGADFAIASKIFLRAELLWGFRTPNADDNYYKAVEYNIDPDANIIHWASVPKIKVAAGYKL
ncbi:hypothetical protein FACS189494_10920 [Spirochaetia bacterium]|nr:hypothetical protein FACS189494_10920 [Spirochaetia bacterium]